MKVINNSHLYLTKAEKDVLSAAAPILDKIATAMDRAVQVSWCMYDDEEIWGAQEIIESLVRSAKDEDEDD